MPYPLFLTNIPDSGHPALHHAQSLCHNCNEVLDIGNHGGGAETSPVQKLVYHKLIRIHGIQVHRTYGAVGHHPEMNGKIQIDLMFVYVEKTKLFRN